MGHNGGDIKAFELSRRILTVCCPLDKKSAEMYFLCRIQKYNIKIYNEKSYLRFEHFEENTFKGNISG